MIRCGDLTLPQMHVYWSSHCLSYSGNHILRHLGNTYSIILGDMISQLTSWPLALRIVLLLFSLYSLTSEGRHPGQIQLKLLEVWCPKYVAVFFSKRRLLSRSERLTRATLVLCILEYIEPYDQDPERRFLMPCTGF